MRKRKKITLTLIITFTIILIAFVIFAIKLASISVPSDYVEYKVNLITDSSFIYENIYGIPHIITKNEEDLFFLMGFVHARDRLWQMDISRRTASGKLSEVFGKETINIDKYLRSFQFENQSQYIFSKLDANLKNLLNSYSNGVNFYIEKNYRRLPFEFAVLGYIPSKWQPTDCIAIQKLIALKFSQGFVYDLILGEIADKIGVTKTFDLIPKYPNNAPCILDDRLAPNSKSIQQNDSLAHISNVFELKKNFPQHNLLLDILNKVHNKPNASGSNSWVRKKSDSVKTGAILVSDPHLELTMPPFWYQIHLTCPSINTIGLSIPGIPIIYIGRNDYIAWGITQSMIDDCDLYFERISNDSTTYLDFDGKQTKFKKNYDTIKVRNSEDYIYSLVKTNRSSILSFDSSISKINTKLATSQIINKFCLTYSWTGSFYSDEINAGYKVLKAKNWKEFKQALENWGSPSFVFTFADINGNIGAIPIGYVPIRNKLCNNTIPNPGWLPDYSWNGYSKASSIGELYNPQRKYIISANNKISSSSNPIGYYTSPSRAIRIDSLLRNYFEYSARDAQVMLLDVFSPFAFKIHSKIIPIIDSSIQFLNPNQSLAYKIMKEWNCFYGSNSSGAMIFSEFLDFFIKNTFSDEMSEVTYNDFSLLPDLGLNKIYEIIDIDTLNYYDDKRTNNIENKKDIIYKSFIDAINSLANKFNKENPYEWTYGKLNIIEIEHFLESNNFLRPVLSLDPVEGSGASTTINYSEKNSPYSNKIKYGVSARFIADMDDIYVSMVLPGGNSGHPHSPNYSNQFRLWYTGNYISVPISRTPNPKFKLSVSMFPNKK